MIGRLRTANVDVDLVPVTGLKAHKIEHLQRNLTQINIASPPKAFNARLCSGAKPDVCNCMRVYHHSSTPSPQQRT